MVRMNKSAMAIMNSRVGRSVVQCSCMNLASVVMKSPYVTYSHAGTGLCYRITLEWALLYCFLRITLWCFCSYVFGRHLAELVTKAKVKRLYSDVDIGVSSRAKLPGSSSFNSASNPWLFQLPKARYVTMVKGGGA
jgi:hypothetical protein